MTHSIHSAFTNRSPRHGAAILRRAAQGVALAALLGVSACGDAGPMAGTPDSSLRLASIFMSAGAPEPALRAAEDALSRQPRNTDALAIRADALAALGRPEEAQLAYLDLIARAPAAVAPRIALGRMLVKTNPAAAEAVFEEVLAREPRNTIALNNIGIARDLQGRHQEAQSAYRTVLAADPRNAGTGANLGMSLVLSGDPRGAVEVLGPLSAAPDAPASVQEYLGIALAATGATAEAQRVLARVMPPDEIAATLAQHRPRPEATPRVAAATPAPRPAPAPAPASAPTAIAPAPAAPPVQTAPAPIAPAPISPAPAALADAPPPAPLPSSDVMVPMSRVERLPQAEVPARAPVIDVPALATPQPADIQPADIQPADTQPTAAGAAPAEPPPPPAPIATPIATLIAPPTTQAIALAVAAAPRQAGPRQAFVQLAATESEEGAQSEWRRLRKRHGDLLRDRSEVTMVADVSGRTVWRLRTGPFQQRQEAEAFCAELRATGGKCWTAGS